MAIDSISIHFPYERRRVSGGRLVFDTIDETARQHDLLFVYKGMSNGHGGTFKLSGHDLRMETTFLSRNHASKITHIRMEKMVGFSFRHITDLLDRLDAPLSAIPGCPSDNGIYLLGNLQRLDYCIDLPYDVLMVMMGLHVSHRGFLYGLQDLFDPEHTHIEHCYSGGEFRSFRIGGGDRYIRIYDRNKEQGIADEVTGGPVTRIELSLNTLHDIREVMNQATRHTGVVYSGRLTELEDHLSDIANGFSNPFANVLLNHVTLKDPATVFSKDDMVRPDFWNEVRQFMDIQRDISLGLFLNVCRRMNQDRNFFRRYSRYFHLHPWQERFQLTHAYRRSVRRFLGLNTRVQPYYRWHPPYTLSGQPLTRWPRETTI